MPVLAKYSAEKLGGVSGSPVLRRDVAPPALDMVVPLATAAMVAPTANPRGD